MTYSRASAAIAAVLAFCFSPVFTQRDPAIRAQSFSLPEFQISKRASKLVDVSAEEEREFESKTRDGVRLLKIYAAPKCIGRYAVNVSDPRCLEDYELAQVSYYSFVERSYGLGFADVEFSEDGIRAGMRGTYGLILEIADTDISALTKESDATVPITDFPIAKTDSDASGQQFRFEKGVERDGLQMSAQRPIGEGKCYVLRTIRYGEYGRVGYDSAIALRVERINEQGVVYLLWKRLFLKTAPILKKE